MPTPSPFRRWLRRLAWIALVPAAGWAVASTALWLGQEQLLFHPVALAPDTVLATAPDVHERAVEVPGATLSVLELRRPDPRGVVFFLHGNGGNLREWFVNLEVYRRANVDLVMFDYRGYGKSSGRIESEAQLHADVQAVWQAVAERYRGKPVVVYGRSLGTGLAAVLAARIAPALTILVSPYRSIAALAQEQYPWVPVAALRYPLETERVLPRLHTPLLLVHGDRDALIPIAHSRALQALVPQARLVEVEGAGHNDLHTFDSYRQTMAAALDALR